MEGITIKDIFKNLILNDLTSFEANSSPTALVTGAEVSSNNQQFAEGILLV